MVYEGSAKFYEEMMAPAGIDPAEYTACIYKTGSFRLYVFGVFGKVVAPAGIEPARPCGLQILSLLRLPVSPRGHTLCSHVSMRNWTRIQEACWTFACNL